MSVRAPGAAHRLPSYRRNRPTNDHKWLLLWLPSALLLWRRSDFLAFTVIVLRAVAALSPPILPIKFLWFLKNMFTATSATPLASVAYQLLPPVWVCVCLQWLLPQTILVVCAVVSVLHAQNGPTPNWRIAFIKFSRISESNAFVYIYAYTCTYISWVIETGYRMKIV